MEKFRSYLFFWSCFALIAGIFLIDWVRILPSISMILLVMLGISHWLKKTPKGIAGKPLPFYMMAATFLILIPSWFYSDNHDYLFEKWQIAIPYLLLPLAFTQIPRMSERRFFLLYEFYFLCALGISLIAFGYYLTHQELVNQMYLESKVMPTLMSHHPTLSLMLVLATYISYWLYQSKRFYKHRFEKNLFAIGGIFLFIFVHIFSVRSGLLALYVVLLLEIIKWIYQKRQFKKALLAGISLMLIGAATLFLSPTVSNKLANTTQDLNNYQNKGSANNQSLSSRMISYENAIRIAKESNIWFGCGLGDINDLNNQIFQKDYPDVSKPIIPHNQFLFYLAAIGITGVLAFTVFFYFPFFYHKAYQDSLLFVHFVIISIGFQFESPLESQVGTAFTLLFLLLPLHKMFGPKSFSSF